MAPIDLLQAIFGISGERTDVLTYILECCDIECAISMRAVSKSIRLESLRLTERRFKDNLLVSTKASSIYDNAVRLLGLANRQTYLASKSQQADMLALITTIGRHFDKTQPETLRDYRARWLLFDLCFSLTHGLHRVSYHAYRSLDKLSAWSLCRGWLSLMMRRVLGSKDKTFRPTQLKLRCARYLTCVGNKVSTMDKQPASWPNFILRTFCELISSKEFRAVSDEVKVKFVHSIIDQTHHLAGFRFDREDNAEGEGSSTVGAIDTTVHLHAKVMSMIAVIVKSMKRPSTAGFHDLLVCNILLPLRSATSLGHVSDAARERAARILQVYDRLGVQVG